MSDSRPPAWLRDGQLRWAWLSWEPLMMYRRVGMQFETIEGNAHWSEDWFRRLHSEEFIQRLAEAGFNCVTTHFHKGFGMAAEADEMEMTRDLVALCHRHGIRVLAYVQSLSIMYETFFAEQPEAREWLGMDRDGRTPKYGDQYWRVIPCLSHDGYVEHIKRVTEKAIVWAGADGISLDNTGMLACRCAACEEKFAQYLREQHPHPDPTRFGIADLDHVRVAVEGDPRDPIVQESIRFRCRALTRFMIHLRDYVRGLNRDAVVCSNITVNSPMNFYSEYGVDYSNASRAADIMLAENGDFPTMAGDIPITQLRYYKIGHATGAVVIPSNWLLEEADSCVVRMPRCPEDVKLDLAEAAAYGRRCIGATWAARPEDMGRSTFLERPDVYKAVTQYNTFFKAHEELYVGTESVANVATYRNFSSLAFHYDDVYASLTGYEQALLQNQIPFEVLFTEDLDRLAAFDVLLLPNILCMSDGEIDRIRAFVRSGKGLVATGETSLYDADYRQRCDYGLADLFGASYNRRADPAQCFRNGRVVFTPGTPEKVDCNRFNYQTRAPLPADTAALLQYVRDVSPAELPVEITATPYITTEVCRAKQGIVVHLVNHSNHEVVKDVAVVVI